MVHPDRCSPSRTSMMSSVCQQSDVPSRWQRPAATAHSSRCWNCWVPASPPAIKTVTELLLIQTYDIRLRNRKQYITCRWSVTSIINHQSTKRSYINKEIINYVSFASGDVVPGPTDAAAADSLRKSDSIWLHVTSMLHDRHRSIWFHNSDIPDSNKSDSAVQRNYDLK